MEADNTFPNIVNIEIQISELWKLWTSELIYQNDTYNICSEWDFYSETGNGSPYCSAYIQSDIYSFQTDFMLPQKWWMNLFVHGLTFKVHVYIDDMECSGQFVSNKAIMMTNEMSQFYLFYMIK